MVRIIELDENGLTTQQVLDAVESSGGDILLRAGQVIARIEPADNADLEDEVWAREPEQINRGEEAREH